MVLTGVLVCIFSLSVLCAAHCVVLKTSLWNTLLSGVMYLYECVGTQFTWTYVQTWVWICLYLVVSRGDPH